MNELREAAENFYFCVQGFRKDIEDVGPRFFQLAEDLMDCLEDGDEDACRKQILQRIRPHFRLFGAPGDFGYDHPVGQSLSRFYKAWNATCDPAVTP